MNGQNQQLRQRPTNKRRLDMGAAASRANEAVVRTIFGLRTMFSQYNNAMNMDYFMEYVYVACMHMHVFMMHEWMIIIL